MLYWNYYLAVSTDPGRVPKSWVSGGTYFRILQPDSWVCVSAPGTGYPSR